MKTGSKGPSKRNFGPKGPKKVLDKTNHDMIVMVKTKHNPEKIIDLGIIEPKGSNRGIGPKGPESRMCNNSRMNRNLGVVEPEG